MNRQYSFRRVLKQILKNAQRKLVDPIDWKVMNQYVDESLGEYGLVGSFSGIVYALKSFEGRKYVKGRHFYRLGKAAKRQGKLAPIFGIARAMQLGEDLRTVPFYTR